MHSLISHDRVVEMCCNCCSVRQQKIWVFGLAGFFVVLGIVLLSAWPSIVRQLIRDMLPLAQDSFMYKNWVTTPLPVHTTFYLFNWTNPEDLNNPDVKPNFEQLGPYTFSDYKVKEDLMWQQPEVTYYGRRTFHFLPEHSNGSLDDIVTSPNIPSVVSVEIRKIGMNCQSTRLKKKIEFGLYLISSGKIAYSLRPPPHICANIHAPFVR